MRKKDVFFACLFMVCFMVSGVSVTGEFLYKSLESILGNSHNVVYVREEVYGQKDAEKPAPPIEEVCQVEQSEEKHLDETTNDETAKDITAEQEPKEIAGIADKVVEIEPKEEQELSEVECVGNEYFDDALFIGDSRTVGIMEYGNIGNATFFADTGMTVFDLEKKEILVSGEGKVSFDEVLEKEQYGKVYLMLGINELGYRFESIEAKYKQTVEKIRMSQPDAVIYVCANMHVTVEQSKKDAIYNNENVNRVNEMIAGLAGDENIIYIDVNELFDDAEGGLSTEYSSDSFHVYGRYYMAWVEWLCTKAVVCAM